MAAKSTRWTCNLEQSLQLFPSDLFSNQQLKSGLIIIHIIGAFTLVGAMFIVVESYLMASLKVTFTRLGFGESFQMVIYGCTTTLPVCFSLAVMMLFAESDMGLAGAFGSSCFNCLVLVASAGIYTLNCDMPALQCSKFPANLECFLLWVALITMMAYINAFSYWYIAVALPSIYMLYFALVCCYWRSNPVAFPTNSSTESSSLHVNVDEERLRLVETSISTNSYQAVEGLGNVHSAAAPVSGEDDVFDHVDDADIATSANTYGTAVTAQRYISDDATSNDQSDRDLAHYTAFPRNRSIARVNRTRGPYYITTELNDYEHGVESPFAVPESWTFRVLWLFSIPCVCIFHITIPDCRVRVWRKWYLVTLIMSTLWLFLLSYCLVWLILTIVVVLNLKLLLVGTIGLGIVTSLPGAVSTVMNCELSNTNLLMGKSFSGALFTFTFGTGCALLIAHGMHRTIVFTSGMTHLGVATLGIFVTASLLMMANGWKLQKHVCVILLLLYVIHILVTCIITLSPLIRNSHGCK